ncbi:MAG: glycoside hydrolase [Chloroflexi bacterium]|nr:MAG: glycoside hydrolase [Chloroflexota bacterium]
MTHPTYPRPSEPLVSKNTFRQRAYQPQPIPVFSQARPLLPVPILPEHATWVEMYWRAWEMAWSNLRQPTPASGFVANFIDTAFNDNTFMWDSAFMVQFGLYARRIVDFMGTLSNFYAKQHEDGFICREINTYEGYDYFYPFDPNGTGPNILAWAEWRYYRATGDDSRLKEVFWPLVAYHRWCRAHRTWPDGMYWATGLSSGMDNQPRVPDSMHYHRHWTWVDANMQAALSCYVLSQMAQMLGEEALVMELGQERAHLIHQINARLWNEEQAFYQDVSPDGRFSKVKSIGAYWGLLDPGIVPEKRLAKFIQPLRESWAFKLPHRIPSQSADSEGYNAETGHYWRGGVWAPTNYMVLKGLRQVGQHGLAHEIAINHLQNVSAVYQRTDTFWENYAPETAAPGDPAKPDFVGWTGLSPIAVLLEDVIGIGVDWPQRRVFWDRRLETESEYGVQNYPLGGDGTMSLLGDAQRIVVTTDVPFTLTVWHGETQLQTAVSPGTTEIDLT